MVFSLCRFAGNGWIEELYIQPKFFFSYLGFEWVKPLGTIGTYALFLLAGLSALGILLGYRYRLSAILFFLSFTYIELMDKSNYLNHYYFVSLIAFLMCFMPAGKAFSLDVKWGRTEALTHIPRYYVLVIQVQLAITYFFAGLAKINADWLLEALPLKMWLPVHADWPVVGQFMGHEGLAYFFSWSGAIYDLFIPFLLWYNRSRPWAYATVILFHLLTWLLFPIGVFPWVMIACTSIFFAPNQWEKLFQKLGIDWNKTKSFTSGESPRMLQKFFAFYLVLQLVLPLRFLAYPGSVFWTEQGYRFSWRVMLMEKAGMATFYWSVDGKSWSEVNNREYLSPNQEKMMSTQPDMLLEFAHYLADIKELEYGVRPQVRAEVFVTLNGRNSRPFIDKNVNLSAQKRGFHHKSWILDY